MKSAQRAFICCSMCTLLQPWFLRLPRASPIDRIFFLANYKLFLVVVFFSHFQASSTRVRIFLKKEIFLSIVEKKPPHVAYSNSFFARPHEDAAKNGITIASLTGHALYGV